VTFFLMEAVGGNTALHDHEMEEVRWFPLAEAPRVANYRTERELIRRAVEQLGAGR
jgi:NADH pyrophosphatase NudC (nudix superfamily)